MRVNGRADIGAGTVAAAVFAVVAGVTIAWLDSRPGWDSTGITAGLTLITAAVAAFIGTRHPWLWAIVVGVWVPLFELSGPAGTASLLALAIAAIGSVIGWAAASERRRAAARTRLNS